MQEVNRFEFVGRISPDEDISPLVQNDGSVSGATVVLQQMGVSLSAYIPARCVMPDRLLPLTVLRIAGHLVPKENGWPKIRVDSVEIVATATGEAPKVGAGAAAPK